LYTFVVSNSLANNINTLAQNNGIRDLACFEDAIANGSAGVSQYWTARKYDLYNSKNIKVLSTGGDLKLFPWLGNIDWYDRDDFNFVVTNNIPQYGAFDITPAHIAFLGEPSKIDKCTDVSIYFYYKGTASNELLNQTIKKSYQEAKNLAKQNKIKVYMGYK
jgi:hypothetical protein